MRKLLIAAALAASTGAFADCDPSGHFSPYVCPDTPVNSVPEPETWGLLIAAAIAGGLVKLIRRKK